MNGSVSLEPAAAVDPWREHMLRGEFAQAWEISDAVLRGRRGVACWHRPRHEQYIWDGTPLAGKRVLIRCYHGLGDTVQFIRYAPLVRAIARETIVWAQPALLPLLRTVRGIDRLLPLHDGTPDVDYDVDVEVMELPHVFRTTLETIPACVPYLEVRPVSLPATRGLRVGLVWSAGGWDHRRSLRIASLAPLLALPQIEWHALQRGPALADWPEAAGAISGSDHPEATAAVMRALDLVITVDSFTAHLAGALAVPTWTLLHADADWRWMCGCTESPWYPTMRLYRQRAAGDWSSAIADVADDLASAAAARELTTHAHTAPARQGEA